MKRLFTLGLLVVTLGGCIIIPVGHGYHRDGWHDEHYGDYRRGYWGGGRDGYHR